MTGPEPEQVEGELELASDGELEPVRYVVPDYARLLAGGSGHLGLPPATELDGALETLLAAYHALPGPPGRAIPLGRLDVLLAPFCAEPASPESDRPERDSPEPDSAERLTAFWGRLAALPGPGYATIGPADGPVARALIAAVSGSAAPVDGRARSRGPRLVLRVDPERPADGLLAAALAVPAAAGGITISNDARTPAGIGPDHAVLDGGISFPAGGGGYGLVRFDLLASVLQHHGSWSEYLASTLPGHLDLFVGLLAARSARLARASDVFGTGPDDDARHWLAREGLLRQDRFGAVFAVTGVAEALGRLSAMDEGGPVPPAAELLTALRDRIEQLVAAVPMPHCVAGGGRVWLYLPSGRPGWTDLDEPSASSGIEAVMVSPAGAGDPRALVAEVGQALAEGVQTARIEVAGRERRVTGFLARARTGPATELGPADGGYVAGTVDRSSLDGPGERFVVFLQGCSYDCLTCHNPCSIPITPPGMARTAAADVVAAARAAAAAVTGVTVSGGEATLQAPFIRALFEALRDDPVTAGLTRFVDSNGDCEPDVWQLLAPVTDGVMLDLKALDDEIHIILTGSSNVRSLASIREVARLGLLHEVRLLLVPGLNDADQQLRETAGWLLGVDPRMRVVVNAFRRAGTRACARDLLEPGPADLARYREVLTAAGITRLAIPAGG